MSKQTRASELFDAMAQWFVLEDRVGDELMRACGIDVDRVDAWPLGDIVFDDYDSSFEFWTVRPDWVPTPDQLRSCFALGFSRCWICYTDGTERYYTPNHLEADARPVQHPRSGEGRRNARRAVRELKAKVEELEGRIANALL